MLRVYGKGDNNLLRVVLTRSMELGFITQFEDFPKNFGKVWRKEMPVLHLLPLNMQHASVTTTTTEFQCSSCAGLLRASRPGRRSHLNVHRWHHNTVVLFSHRRTTTLIWGCEPWWIRPSSYRPDLRSFSWACTTGPKVHYWILCVSLSTNSAARA